MPLQLNFRVEDRGGVMVLITKGQRDEEIVRPASSAEVELWHALTHRYASPARESYIRVNEQDLVTVIMERDYLRRQVADQLKQLQDLQEDRAKKALDVNGQERDPHEAGDDECSPGGEQGT